MKTSILFIILNCLLTLHVVQSQSLCTDIIPISGWPDRTNNISPNIDQGTLVWAADYEGTSHIFKRSKYGECKISIGTTDNNNPRIKGNVVWSGFDGKVQRNIH